MNRFILVLLMLFLTATVMPVHAKEKHTTYPATLLAGSGGKILPDRVQLFEGRKNVKFLIKPDNGFVVANVVLNGTPLGRVPVVAIPVVTGPVSIEATFTSGIATVDAGNDVTTFAGVPVTLHPTATPAIPGDPLRYDWQIIKKPVKVRAGFIDHHAVAPAFLAPRPGDYVVQLRVTEGRYKATDTVVVHVLPSPEANPPVAVPIAPSTVLVGQQITLSGSGSYDPSGLPLNYNWQMLSRPQGSTAALTNTTSVSPTFTPDLAGAYQIMLTVSNRYAAGKPQLVQIQVRQNAAPVAVAGPDQGVPAGTTVLLDGSASSDVDGDPLTFFWAFQSCPQGNCPALSHASAVNPSFVAELPGAYVLTLTVGDGSSLTSTDTVLINSAAPPADAPPILGLRAARVGSLGPLQIVTSVYVNGFWSESTVQNVNESRSAFEKRMAMNAAGDAVLVMREEDGMGGARLYARTFSKGAWSAPAEISHGQFPSVVIDAAGNALAAWTETGFNYSWKVHVSRYDAVTRQWGPATMVGKEMHDSDFVSLANAGNGDAFVVFRASNGFVDDVYASRYTNGVWGLPVSVAESVRNAEGATIAMNGSGDALATWYQKQVDNTWAIYARRFSAATGAWSASKELIASVPSFTPFLDVLRTKVADNGDAAVYWKQGFGQVYEAHSSSPGAAWTQKALTGVRNVQSIPLSSESLGVATWEESAPDGTAWSIIRRLPLE